MYADNRVDECGRIGSRKVQARKKEKGSRDVPSAPKVALLTSEVSEREPTGSSKSGIRLSTGACSIKKPGKRIISCPTHNEWEEGNQLVYG